MRFSDIAGQEKIKEVLRGFVKQDRVPHALLFTGAKGTAKTALAISLTHYLLCENRSEEPCGECKSCKKTFKYIHPDIHYVFPVVTKGKKRRADTISADFMIQWRTYIAANPYGDLTSWSKYIEAGNTKPNINTKECSELSRKMGLQSFESEYKILIIWNAESLGKEGNRLLKLIEEPPEKTLILILAENADQVLNTISSRCQHIHVPPFTDDEMMTTLSDQQKDKESLLEIVHLSEGNMQQALTLLDSQDMHLSEQLLDWFRKAYQCKGEEVLSWVNAMAATGKQQQKNFLMYGLFFMREYMKALHYGSVDNIRLTPKEKDTVIKMSKIIDLEKAEHIISIININLNYLDRNANAKILFMDMTIGLEQIMKETLININ